MHRYFLGLWLANWIAAAAALVPTDLRCELREAPLGIDQPHPQLSWTLVSTDPNARGVRQSAYQILVASSPDAAAPGQADLWDSGKVSDRMAYIAYAGKPLASDQGCWWVVQVWDQADLPSGWSSPARWTMGLLGDHPWQAEWLRAPEGGETSGPLPLFRRELALDRPVKRALVHICGLGFYELSINGRKIGDLVLDPGWTDYRKRCLYTTYDVTGYLQTAAPGPHPTAVGVMLGNGMFNVRGGRYTKFTGTFGPPKFILQMLVEFVDGTATNLLSDSSWKTAPGPLTFSCIYGGEDYDARRERTGWDQPGFDDTSWRAAVEASGPGGRLVSQSAPPIKVMDTFAPQKISEPAPGVFVYDLGQNFSGWPWLETVAGWDNREIDSG